MTNEPKPETSERKCGPVMDWEQVRLNGGPPCWARTGEHMPDGREKYCGRAERWPGHPADHQFVQFVPLYVDPEPVVYEATSSVPVATEPKVDSSGNKRYPIERPTFAPVQPSATEPCAKCGQDRDNRIHDDLAGDEFAPKGWHGFVAAQPSAPEPTPRGQSFGSHVCRDGKRREYSPLLCSLCAPDMQGAEKRAAQPSAPQPSADELLHESLGAGIGGLGPEGVLVNVAPQLSAERALELAVHFDKGYMTGSALSYVLEAAPYLRAYAAQCETITERYNYERKLLTTIATQSETIRQHEEMIARLRSAWKARYDSWKKVCAERDAALRTVAELRAERRTLIDERSAVLHAGADVSALLAAAQQTIAERDATIKAKDDEILRCKRGWQSAVDERNGLRKLLAERDATIEELERRLTQTLAAIQIVAEGGATSHVPDFRAFDAVVALRNSRDEYRRLNDDAQTSLITADRKNGELLRESERVKRIAGEEAELYRTETRQMAVRLASAEERNGKLERYTGHARSCAAVTCDRLGNRVSTGKVCDCGLAALLAEEKPEVTK